MKKVFLKVFNNTYYFEDGSDGESVTELLSERLYTFEELDESKKEELEIQLVLAKGDWINVKYLHSNDIIVFHVTLLNMLPILDKQNSRNKTGVDQLLLKLHEVFISNGALESEKHKVIIHNTIKHNEQLEEHEIDIFIKTSSMQSEPLDHQVLTDLNDLGIEYKVLNFSNNSVNCGASNFFSEAVIWLGSTIAGSSAWDLGKAHVFRILENYKDTIWMSSNVLNLNRLLKQVEYLSGIPKEKLQVIDIWNNSENVYVVLGYIESSNLTIIEAKVNANNTLEHIEIIKENLIKQKSIS